MPSLFEAYGLTEPEAGPTKREPEPRGFGGVAKDVGISALKGAIAVPEAAVGVADLVTGGRAGQVAESAGFRPREAKAMLDEGYSEQQKEAFRRVQAADGFGETLLEAVRNPSVVGHAVVESLPLMGAGGVVARGGMALAPRLAPVAAGAMGEGVVGAGSAAEAIRQQTADGTLDGRQALLAAGTGVLTSGFAALGGKIAKELGLVDVDTMLTGAASNPAVAKGLTRRVLEGAVAEGLLEELPQSVQEQVLQNAALGKPLDEGVNQAAVLGLLSGGAMGGAVNVFQPKPPVTGALTRAANVAPAVVAQPVTAATGMEAPAQDTAPQEPLVDPVVDRINKLQGTDRSEALAAYNILNRDDAPKGVRQYNSRLLDELMAKLEPAEEGAPPVESSDPAALLASTMGRDPVQGALEEQRNHMAALQNVENWMARAQPLALDHAQDLQAAAAERGLAMEVVPHAAGQGFTVIPAEWITPEMRGQVATALPLDSSPTGVLRADATGKVAPETGAQAIDSRNVAAAQAAERQRKNELGLTPDVEAVQAGVKRAPKPEPLPTDVKNKSGVPFKNKGAALRAQKAAGGGDVIEVQGGWVVRTQAAAAAVQQELEGTDVGDADTAGAGAPVDGGQRGDDAQRGGADAALPGVDPGGGVAAVSAAPAASSVAAEPVSHAPGESAAAVAEKPAAAVKKTAKSIPKNIPPKEATALGGERWTTADAAAREGLLLAAGWKAGSPGLEKMKTQAWDKMTQGQRNRIAKVPAAAPAPADAQVTANRTADAAPAPQEVEKEDAQDADRTGGDGSEQAGAAAAVPGVREAGDAGRAEAAAATVAAPAATAAPAAGGVTAASNTEDAGAELTYNRRNRIRSGLKWSDLEKMDPALRVREAKKEKVYPRPDYAALVDEVLHPVVAHIVKQAYDAIATQPQTPRGRAPTDEDIQTYIGGVNRYMEGVLSWARDESAVKPWLGRIGKHAAALSGAGRGVVTNLSDLAGGRDTGRSLLDTVYPSTADNQRGWRAHEAEVRILGGNKALAALQPNTDEAIRALQDIEKGWPGAQEAWQKRGYQVVSGAAVKVDHYAGQNYGTKEAYVYAHVVLPLKGRSITLQSELFKGSSDPVTALAWAEKRATELRDKHLLLNKSHSLQGAFDTTEAAIEKARELTKRDGSGQVIDEKGTSVEHASRKGPARRKDGESITSEQLKDTFGFKGVNFGNWLKGKSNTAERQLHLNHAYDSFHDLAELLGVPPKAMSLDGMLGLAIGAQGGGGRAAAHFVPGVNEINLTRTAGAGALAHEWGHALDHYFARQAGVERTSEPYLTEHLRAGGDLRPEILERFKAIVTAMNKRPQTADEAAKAAQASMERARSNLDGWIKAIERDFKDVVDAASMQKVFERLRKGDVGEYVSSGGAALRAPVAALRDDYRRAKGRAYSIDNLKGLQSNAERLKWLLERDQGTKTHEPQMVSTEYAREAAKLDKDKGGKPYWSTNLEKFARAFDAFVFTKLEEKAISNTYVAGLNRSPETSPQGEERTAINAAIQALVDTIETRETDRGVAMFRRTAVAEAAGARASTIQGFVDQITAKWANAPDVVVVESMQDPKVPEKVRDADAAQRSQDADEQVHGFHFEGKVYLVAAGLPDAQTALTTLAHEALGHYGLQGFFGEALKPIKQQIVAMRKKEVLAKAEAYGMPVTAQAVRAELGKAATDADVKKVIDMRLLYAAEEVLAEMAQTTPNIGFVRRAIAAIRTFLRDTFGLELELTDDEIVRSFILPARGWVVRGRATGAKGQREPVHFHRAFHGTPHDFDSFTTEKIGTGEGAQAFGWGLYFAENKGVAEHYRRTLTTDGYGIVKINGKPATQDADFGQMMVLEVDDRPEKTLTGAEGYAWMRKVLDSWKENKYGPGEQARFALDYLGNAEADGWPIEVPGRDRHGALLEVEIPDDTVAKMLLWDKPLSEQPKSVREVIDTLDTVRNLSGQNILKLDPTGEELYRALSRSLSRTIDEFEEGKAPRGWGVVQNTINDSIANDAAASKALDALGIPGIRYLDGQSRNRPLKDIKRAFLAQLPEDADFDEVLGLANDGTFSAKNAAIVKALAADDWLGFDYPSQAISAALSDRLSNFDASPALAKAVADAQVDDATHNLVVFNEKKVKLTHKNGEPVTKAERAQALKGMHAGEQDVPQFSRGGSKSDAGLKAAVLKNGFQHDQKRLTPIQSDGMLAAKFGKQEWPVFVMRGTFGRDQFKAAFEEAKTAGLSTDKMLVFADLASYTSNGMTFTKLDEVPGTKGSEQLPMFSRGDSGNVLATTRPLRESIIEAMHDTFKAPGKLNWWHKTVGTQYNLAQRSPEFKRVFDSVQDFLNDVSMYASEAADLAPKILPKLETWRDIGKAPISAEDNKAVSAPVFEGTLLWARDERGRPVKIDELRAKTADLPAEEKAQRMLRAGAISENVLKMWKGLPLAQYEAAVATRFESQMLRAGVVWSDEELRSQFKLTDGQVALYKEFRAAVDRSITHMAISDMVRFGGKDVEAVRQEALDSPDVDAAALILRDHLLELAGKQPDRNDVLIDTAERMIEKADRARDLMDHGYAPLSRFGHYTVDVIDETGERVFFGMFESAREAALAARKMKGNFPKATITRGTVSEEEYKLFAGVSPETVELFGEMLGLEAGGDDASSKAFQTYIKVAKANRSAMKRLIERKGIAGFSEDVGRVLAGFVYSNARQTAQNLHMGEMTDAAAQVSKGEGELKDQATRLVEYIKKPQEEAQAFRGLLFAQYLGGSVASGIVNMLQPAQVTFPYLSQFGGAAKAAARMAAAFADQGKKTTGDAALDAALKKAEEEGIVAPQEVHQLMAQAQGRGVLKSGDGTLAGDTKARASNALSRLTLAWGKFFGAAEQFNRRVTFIAAYRTAVQQGIEAPAAFAEKAIAETQFIYNKGNKPEWARGAIGSTLFTFKQYSISYVELLHRMSTQGGPEGKRAALLALGMLFLMSGAGGLPFAEDVEDLVDGVMQRLGYNFSSKLAKKQFFEGMLGKDLGRFAEHGLSGLPGVPIDVSGRLGLGNLLPGTGLLVAKDDHTRDATEVAGVAGDFASRMFKGANKLAQGQAFEAAKEVIPRAALNATRGLEMFSTGMYKDDKGRKVIDVDGFDAAMKGIGFQPTTVARVQEATGLQQRLIAGVKKAETQFADRWAKAVAEGDQEALQEVRADVADYNAKNPDTPVRINRSQINKRVRALREDKATRIEKTAPKEIRSSVRQALEAP